MIKYLNKIGITDFKNAKYTYKTKKVDILGDGSPFDTKTQIETWELEGGYRYINISIGVDDEWSTAFSARYTSNALFDTTKIGNYIGEKLMFKYELSFMDGYEEDESYYFTSEYNNTIEVLKSLITTLGKLELESEEVKDTSFTVYSPYKAFNQLKNNILENVKDLSDIEEVKEVAEIFMEHHGEDYRSILFSDSRLIYISDDDLKYVDMIENLMYEYFSEDEVLLDED